MEVNTVMEFLKRHNGLQNLWQFRPARSRNPNVRMATFGMAGDDLKTLQKLKADKCPVRFLLSECKLTISKKQVDEAVTAQAEPVPLHRQSKAAEKRKTAKFQRTAKVPTTLRPRRVRKVLDRGTREEVIVVEESGRESSGLTPDGGTKNTEEL